MIVLVVAVVQLLSSVWLFAAPRTAARQASLSITNSRSLLRLMSIESVMPSNHLILSRPLLLPSIFPSIRVFSNESALGTEPTGGQSIGASGSVHPMNIQGWFPLGLTGLISLQSKDSQESSPAPPFKSISSSALSLLKGSTLKSVHNNYKNHSFD